MPEEQREDVVCSKRMEMEIIILNEETGGTQKKRYLIFFSSVGSKFYKLHSMKAEVETLGKRDGIVDGMWV